MNQMARPLAAEFLGTFGFVFVGAGAIVVDVAEAGALGVLGIAFAHALALSVMVTTTLSISGGHLNPAVTFGLWLAKKIDLRMGLLYVLTQLAAGVLAAFLVKLLLPTLAGEASSYGVPRISGLLTDAQAIAIEVILTLFLVSAVFGTAVSREAPRVGGFGIGLVLLFAFLVGGPLTGAALNPARALGPALVAGDWHGHYIYWVGPLAGGLLAGVLWKFVLLPREPRPESG